MRRQQRFDRFSCRHRILRPNPGDRQGAGGGCPPRRIGQRLSFRQRHRQRSVKGVPRRYGVHRRHRKRRGVAAGPPVPPVSPLRPQRNDRGAHAAPQQLPRRPFNGIPNAYRVSHQRFRFRFVGRNERYIAVKIRRQRTRRPRIQNHRNPLRRRLFRNPPRQLHRHLQLQQNRRRLRQQRRDGVVFGVPAGIVGAQRLDDAVLPALAHADDRNARADARRDAHSVRCYAGRLQRRHQLRPEQVVAHPACHRRADAAAAGPRRRHRLVGPLAAGIGHETAAHHRLPVRRQPFRKSHQVHINAAQRHDKRPLAGSRTGNGNGHRLHLALHNADGG